MRGLPAIDFQINIRHNPLKTLKGFYNVTAEILLDFPLYYPEFSIEEIEWDKVKNTDKIVSDLYERIERGGKSIVTQRAEEILSKMQKLGLY